MSLINPVWLQDHVERRLEELRDNFYHAMDSDTKLIIAGRINELERIKKILDNDNG